MTVEISNKNLVLKRKLDKYLLETTNGKYYLKDKYHDGSFFFLARREKPILKIFENDTRLCSVIYFRAEYDGIDIDKVPEKFLDEVSNLFAKFDINIKVKINVMEDTS